MKKLLVISVLMSIGGAIYLTTSPGQKQSKALKELAALETGTWQPLKPSKKENCRLDKKQADPKCTPGETVPAERTLLCMDQELSQTKPVKPSKTTWRKVKKAYRVNSRTLKPNLLIPVRLGGAPSQANTWPLGKKQAAKKRRADYKLWREMCDGKISLNKAQKKTVNQWAKAKQTE